MKKHIPNAITCLNLISGCIGVLMAIQGNYNAVLYCVVASGMFDFFDGFAARLLNVHSPMGLQLDSLADMVSFGFLPGVVLFTMMGEHTSNVYLPYFSFMITVFSALRLAKFNIDTRQSIDFIGLNTPMNTFFIISLPFIAVKYPVLFANNILLILIVPIVSFLLISEIRLFSMKFSSMEWQPNRFKYVFLLLSLILLVFFGLLALPLILIAYILLSMVHFKLIDKSKI